MNVFWAWVLLVFRSITAQPPQFFNQIDDCVNRKDLIPDEFNASISRLNNHIEINVGYEGTYDHYVIDHYGPCQTVQKGLTEPIFSGAEDAVKICERQLTDDLYSFNCPIEVLNRAEDHYAVLVISSYASYELDKCTNEFGFREYPIDGVTSEIRVKQTECDENPVYVAQFEDCLNLKNSIPTDIPLTFNVTKVNQHISILVYDDGKYDYYELDAKGEACYTVVRKTINPTRTVDEQMECDRRPLKLYSEEFQSQLRCGYGVVKNKTDVVIHIRGTGELLYEYNINRRTGTTELYEIQNYAESIDEQINNCLQRQHMSDFDIPLEVTRKKNHLEILVQYQGNYDLYTAGRSGYVRYVEMQLPDKPNLTLAEYAKRTRCYNPNGKYRCPLKVVENAEYVNITVNAFSYDNVYVVDKSTNGIKYIKDNLFLSNLPIPDAELRYKADVDKCIGHLLSLVGPFPIDVARHKDFLEISVNFNGTFDVHATASSGDRICKTTRASVEKPADTAKSLEEVHPGCARCDNLIFEKYTCPSFHFEEDEKEIKLLYESIADQHFTEYTLSKTTGELKYVTYTHSRGSAPPVSNVLKSLIG